MPDSTERIAWIDFARVMAILLIVGFHVAYEFTLDQGLRPYGFAGASLFFIISGFVLAQRYPGLVSFDIGWFWKRYLKIASLYYPALIAVALLFGTQVYSGDAGDILLHFAFLNWLGPATQYTLISPVWFIVPLMGLYVLYPWLNMLTARFRPFILLAVAVSLAVRLMDGTFTSFSPFFFLADFCFGIAMAHGRRDFWLLAPLLLALARPIMAVPFLLFFILSLMPANGPKPVRDALSLAGKSTFVLFLFHESVMKTALGKWQVWGMDVASSLAVLLVSVALAVLLSVGIQRVFGPQRPGKKA